MNYYPFHVGDYALATRHLGLLEDLAYRRLLDLAYTTEAPIPDEIERVSRVIGMREHSEIVSGILSEFFLKSDAGWIHKRAEKEIEKYRKKAASANAANASRWAKAASKKKRSNRRESEIRCESAPNQNQNQNHNNQSITPPTPPAGGKGCGAENEWLEGLPAELDIAEFRAKFVEWIAYRKSIKKPVNLASVPAIFRRSAEVGVRAAIDGFETSMANGWQGAFPQQSTKSNKTAHRDEKRAREYPESLEVPFFKPGA
jgi:uncharacterized protein YdaU (DUF1376 family)